jgi:hypothetical protein
MITRLKSALRRRLSAIVTRAVAAPEPDGGLGGPSVVRTRSTATEGVCLITMARNEPEMLTHWIWYYSQALDRPKFILLDDASDPAMVETLKVRFPEADLDVIRLPEGPFADQYKSNALSALAIIAVERYAVVIATDADEIVMPIGPDRDRDLFEMLRAAPRPFAAPIGLAPIQIVGTEPAFEPESPLRDQRSVGQLRSASCKPCIWQGEPWLFSPGQHGLRQRRVPIHPRLALVHLKYVDAELTVARQGNRITRSLSPDQDEVQARHWKQGPKAMRQLPLFSEAVEFRSAPRLTDAIPGYLKRHFDPWEGGFAVRSLRCIEPVSLEGEL